MTRDFSRNLTILVAGSGNATRRHLEESLGEWIFPDPEAERDVRVIVPVLAQTGGAIRNLVKIGQDWEFEFIPVMVKNQSIPASLSFIDEDDFVYADDERDVLEKSLELLTGWHKSGDETAFIMGYNPESTYEQGNNTLSDFEIIGDAKNYRWLTTLNLCEGLIDSFEGYKSTDELLKEERLKREFEEKKEAEKPVEEKAQVVRRRAAKKTVAPKVTKPVEEPEKPVQTPSEHQHRFVYADADAGHEGSVCYDCGELEDQPVPQTAAELGKMSIEACIAQNVTPSSEFPGATPLHTGPNPHREPLAKDAVLSASVTLPKTKEIWDDVAEAQLQNKIKDHMVYVKKSDLSDLSEGIKDLTQSFGRIMDTFTRILKEN